jgi:hypothetical protein
MAKTFTWTSACMPSMTASGWCMRYRRAPGLMLCDVLLMVQMVPRGWWKMGLLEDLKYYRPFSAN